MKQITEFSQAVIDAIYKDRDFFVKKYNNLYVDIIHEDGSIYHIKHVFVKQLKVGKFPCIMVYCEHNTPILFIEYDLVSVKIKSWKGREKELKLSKYKFKTK